MDSISAVRLPCQCSYIRHAPLPSALTMPSRVTATNDAFMCLQVGQDMFTMDYKAPMTAMQAFGICLSSLDNKVACE